MTEDAQFSSLIAVGLKARELRDAHGADAHQHAAANAKEALAQGKLKESDFWKSVEYRLTPPG